MATESAANAFISQISMAAPMIESGAIGYALLVQSSNMSALLRNDEPVSPWFGDAAAAVVLGPQREGYGILSTSHRTRGEYHESLVGGVPGGRWYEEGATRIYSADETAARRSFLRIPDFASEVTSEALANAGLAPADVDFYAAHQPTAWFREVTQKHLGLTKARYVDTFHFTASVFGANIPISIDIARREGQLRTGDVVLMHAGGVGLTYSALTLRWG
jgi:3-oxoacyl-[acyl-carrier-protein] synthase-3